MTAERAGIAVPPPVRLGDTMTSAANSEVLDWEARACRGDYHPLEFIPAFRRVPPTITRNLAYTFIWNCALGLIFWAIAVGLNPRASFNTEYFVWNLLIAQAIASPLL